MRGKTSFEHTGKAFIADISGGSVKSVSQAREKVWLRDHKPFMETAPQMSEFSRKNPILGTSTRRIGHGSDIATTSACC